MSVTAKPMKRTDLIEVSHILGGTSFISQADWNSGALSLRTYTKAGKPRNRRCSSLPLYVSRALTVEAIGETR